jgi:hypothetical protein
MAPVELLAISVALAVNAVAAAVAKTHRIGEGD